MATKKAPAEKATPAKKTATKTVKEKTVKSTSAPKTKPSVKKADFRPLPFSAPEHETATVTMPNGQTVKRAEMGMLLGFIRLQTSGNGRTASFDAVKIANTLLNTKTSGNEAWLELRMFLERNK